MPEKKRCPAAAAPPTRASPSTAALPGFVAHHEIAFGGLGQTLRIRHDSTGRDSFIPGVILATREVMNRSELVIGLDKLIGL